MNLDDSTSAEATKKYSGIRRRWYWLGMVGISVLNSFLLPLADNMNAILTLGAVLIPLCFTIVVKRLNNTGISGWWSILTLVPIANIYISYRCAVYPEGYQDTKKLDTTGKVLTGVFIILVVSIFAIGFLVSSHS